jgi:fluoroacetyl-CoA thioesterase
MANVSLRHVYKIYDGGMFNFEVFAEDKKGEIARGTHTRVSVKSEKFQMKADSKFDE